MMAAMKCDTHDHDASTAYFFASSIASSQSSNDYEAHRWRGGVANARRQQQQTQLLTRRLFLFPSTFELSQIPVTFRFAFSYVQSEFESRLRFDA